MSIAKKVLHGRLFLALVGGFLAVLICFTSLTDFLDNSIYDFANELNPQTKPNDIVIIAIDEKSIEAFGRWPWPREYHVELLRKLTQAQVKAVAYDVIFSEPDREFPETDRLLAEAIRSNAQVVLPVVIGESYVGGDLFTLAPLKTFSSAAAGVGHVHIHIDNDGLARSVFLKEGLGSSQWHHLSIVLSQTLGNTLDSIPGINKPKVDEEQADVIYRDFHNLIPYVGGEGSFDNLSFVDVIKGNVSQQQLENKIIFVGAQASGLGDIIPTSYGQISGVEINANIFQALRTGKLMTPMSQTAQAGLSFIIVFFTILFFTGFKPGLMLLSAISTIVAVLVLSVLLLGLGKIWFPPSTVVLMVIIVYPLWNWLRLQVAHTFMQSQLVQLETETKIFPSPQADAKSGFFSKDITEENIQRLENAYQQAQHNRELIAKTIDQQTSGVLLVNQQGQLLLTNQYANELLGIDINTKGLECLNLIGIEGEETWSQLIKQTFTKGQAFLCEGAIKTPATDVICRGRLLELDQPVMLLVITDVTTLKANEKSRAETLRFLSHDLRAPLTSVLALIESARMAKTEHTNLSLLDDIEGYIRRNLSYAESFIHMARAEYEKDADTDLCDAYSIVDNAVSQLYHSALKRGIQIQTNQCDDNLWLQCNRVHIERCIVNLLDNAIKHSPSNSRVDLQLGCDTENIFIAIADQGQGIPAHEAPLLFERFKQGTSANSGVGLGLHFVKFIVTAHKGNVEVTPNQPKGTVFTVKLPRFIDSH